VSNSKGYLLFALIVFATIIAYFHSLDHPFTYLDDHEQVVENTNLRALDLPHLKAIYSSTSVGMYQPLSTTIYAVVYALGGLDARFYHWTSLLFHLLNCWLLFKLFERLKIEKWSALLLTSIFALHPMQVESVAWISAFSNLLFTSLYLLALWSYLTYLNGKKMHYWWCLLFFVLSCLSKATAVTLPLVLILFDGWQYGEWKWKKLWDKLPFFLLAIGFGLIAINSRESAGHLSDLSQNFEWHHRIFLISKSIMFYVGKFLCPVQLSAFYPYPEVDQGWFNFTVYLSFLFLALAVWLVYRRRKDRRILIGVLFFLICLAPTLHFIPVGNQLTTDRYLYLPIIGLLLVIGRFVEKWRTLVKQIGFGLLLLVLTIASFYRAKVWQNDQTIWKNVLENYPKVAQAHNNLGSYMLLQGQKKQAFEHFDKAVKLKPYYADAYNNRGNLLSQAGRSEAAMADFNKAIELRPHADAYFNRANELSKSGNLNLAIEDYKQSIKLKPSPDAYTNRAFAYLKLQDLSAARIDLNKAIKIDPKYHPAYFLLAMEARQRQDFDTACRNLELAAKYGNQKAARAIAELCQNNSP